MNDLAGLGDGPLTDVLVPEVDPLTGHPVLSGEDFAHFDEDGLFGEDGEEQEQEEKQVSNPKTGQFPDRQEFFVGVPKMDAVGVIITSTDREEKAAKKREKKAAKVAKAEAKAAKAEALASDEAKAAKKAAAKKAAAKKPTAKKPAAKKPAAKKTTASPKATGARKRAAESAALEQEPAKKKSKEEEPASEAEQELLGFLRKGFISKKEHDEALKGTVSKEALEAVKKELEAHQARFAMIQGMFE